MTPSARRHSSSTFKASIPYRTLLVSILALSVNAQVTIRGAGAYTQAGGKLYFHGGEDGSSDVSDNLYVLDLTKPWTTIAPAWSQLRKSPFANSYHVATHSADNKTLYLIGRNDDLSMNKRPPSAFMNKYSIETNTWTVVSDAMVTLAATPPNSGFFTSNRRDFQGALDPVTRKYVFLGGNNDTSQSNKQDVFEPDTLRVSEREIPVYSGAVLSMAYYQGGALAWLKNGTDSSVYVLGGYSPTNAQYTSLGNLHKFSWATETWDLMYHCAASTADGSKAVIFGGWAPQTVLALNDLWILDAATLSWKQGASVPRGNVGYSACTIAGNQFIVWGGFQFVNSSPPDATPMRIYDISLEKWITTYEPTPEYLAMASPPTNPNNGGNNDNDATIPDSNNTGGQETQGKPGLAVILAGVFGAGFVVLAAVLGFVFHRRRQSKRRLDGVFKPSYNGNNNGGYSKQRDQSDDKYSDDATLPSSSDMTENQALARVRDSAVGMNDKQQHEMKPLKSPELALLEAEERASASPGTTHTYLANPAYGPGNSPELTTGYCFPPPPQHHPYLQGGFPYPPVSPTADRFVPSTYKQEIPSTPTASTFAPANSVYSVSSNPYPKPSQYPNHLDNSFSDLSISAHSQPAYQASWVPSTHVTDSAFGESQGNTYHDLPEPAVTPMVATAAAPTMTAPRVARNPQRHPTVVHQHAFAEPEKSQHQAPQ
ncbi:hypothetical protein BG006_002191 [Podila minutissima]|uniref:Kelch repeat-containing protein n=1 Tax=Podila minutissima TaxID=64525 RepID=A0A9P5SCZ7_9FUNG|nr:hypothetical protein BG006_002191 [Podila minutissima]